MSAQPSSVASSQSKVSIQLWISEYVAQLIGVPIGQIRANIAFDEYGLDSTAAAGLSGDLSDWLGIHLEANIAKKYRTIETLSEQVFVLASQHQGSV